MNKPVNKQDEPWMKPFINQFNSMNFSVSTISHCFAVSSLVVPVISNFIWILHFLVFPLQRDSPDDSMKTGAGMVQDKRMDMGGMGDYNGVMGKNPGSRHQLHKESAMDRSPYYDKVRSNINIYLVSYGWR